MKKYFILIIGALVMLSSCDGDKSSNQGAILQVPWDKDLKSIQVAPYQNATDKDLPVGIKASFKAYGHYLNGSVIDVTKQVQWSILPIDGDAAISLGNGLISTLHPGKFELEAKDPHLAISQSTDIKKVVAAQLLRIFIRPQNTVTSSHALVAGAKFNFKAFATYESGLSFDVSNAVDWQSSQEALVNIESDIPDFVGVASVLKSKDDSVNITAKIGNTSSNIYPLKIVTDSRVDLTTYTRDDILYAGVETHYNAIAYSSDGYQLLLTNGVNWSVVPSVAGSITSDGKFIPNGSINSGLINASFAESMVQSSFKVDTSPVASVEISHNKIPTTLVIGAPLSLEARITYKDSNTPQNITDSPSINWMSTNESVLHFTGNAGNFVAKQTGHAKVIMTYTSPVDAMVESKELYIEVVNTPLVSVVLSPNFSDPSDYKTLPTNYSFGFYVGVEDQNNVIYPILGTSSLIRWSITDGAAIIDPITGVVTTGSTDQNNVTVTASLISDPNIQAKYKFDVLNKPITLLDINPARTPDAKVGDIINYNVVAHYGLGVINADMAAPDRVQWSVDKPDTAAIDPAGKLTALATGTVHVKAQLITDGKIAPRDYTITLTIH